MSYNVTVITKRKLACMTITILFRKATSRKSFVAGAL